MSSTATLARLCASKHPDRLTPQEQGDCFVCRESVSADGQKLVWCKARCGANIHIPCFVKYTIDCVSGRLRCPQCCVWWRDECDCVQSTKGSASGVTGCSDVWEKELLDAFKEYATKSRRSLGSRDLESVERDKEAGEGAKQKQWEADSDVWEAQLLDVFKEHLVGSRQSQKSRYSMSAGLEKEAREQANWMQWEVELSCALGELHCAEVEEEAREATCFGLAGLEN